MGLQSYTHTHILPIPDTSTEWSDQERGCEDLSSGDGKSGQPQHPGATALLKAIKTLTLCLQRDPTRGVIPRHTEQPLSH